MNEPTKRTVVDVEKYQGHTPGPWEHSHYDCQFNEIIGDDLDKPIVTLYSEVDNEGDTFYDVQFSSGPDLNLLVDAPIILADLIATRQERDAAVKVIANLTLRVESLEHTLDELGYDLDCTTLPDGTDPF